MSLSNKLFSLLGFPEPIALNRFDGDNLQPDNLLLLSLAEQPSAAILQCIEQLKITTFTQSDQIADKSVNALVIDATCFIDNKATNDGENASKVKVIEQNSYTVLYEKLHHSIKLLTKNARIVFIAKKCQAQCFQLDAFNESLIGFTKSIAKEVGHKGSTANLIVIDESVAASSCSLLGPLQFLLSSKSTFVSGQVVNLVKPALDKLTRIEEDTRQQKIAVVTGAAQGIGAAIVKVLANDGYYVVGVDIEPARSTLAQTMAQVNGSALVLDVSAENAGSTLANFVAELSVNKHNSGIDLMVHNAGITRDKTIAKMPEHWWQQTLNINLLSVMRVNQQLLAVNGINQKGRIVCLSSMNGIAGQRGQTNYACSKAGIIGYVASISAELAKQNITINAVAPGFIETQMTKDMPYFTREMGRRMNALGQGGLPVDVAQTVAFLGAESSKAITGQTLRVCGLNLIGK